MSYRFAGEVVDVENMLDKAALEGPPKLYSRAVVPEAAAPIDSGGAGVAHSQRAAPDEPPGGEKRHPVGWPKRLPSAGRQNHGRADSSVIDLETGEEKPKTDF